MKPSDHPEFFRLPPPPGASRDSTIVLDAEGRFFHEGGLVEKKSLADAMHRWLAVHPDDGRFILTNGYDWCYLTVEGTPAFVVSVKGDPAGPPVLVLADGTDEPLDPQSLVADAGGTCFARVKGGRFEARFLRHAQPELAPWLREPDHEGAPFRIEIAGRVFDIGRRAQ